MSTSTPTPGFRGLNTVADPLSLGGTWFTKADNAIVTDRGKLRRAPGTTRRTFNTRLTGVYATLDQSRLYVVDAGSLVQINPDFSHVVLATGLADAPMRFTEVNGVVYYANGIDYGIIEPAGRRPWGIAPPASPESVALGSGVLPAGMYQVCCTLTDDRGQESGNGEVLHLTVPAGSSLIIAGIEQRAGYRTRVYVTGANDTVFRLLERAAGVSLTYNVGPDALGEELAFPWANQPHGVLPAYWMGCMYLADPYPSLDQSVVWRSLPLHYHLFDDAMMGITVPGTVLLNAACDAGLIVGTERAIYVWDGARLDMLAPYGVVAGAHPVPHEGKLYFWSLRGLCTALPFANLTESTVSFAPGTSAAAALIEADGFRRFMVALRKGGDPYNARRAPITHARGYFVLVGYGSDSDYIAGSAAGEFTLIGVATGS